MMGKEVATIFFVILIINRAAGGGWEVESAPPVLSICTEHCKGASEELGQSTL